jgi:hypothetical protein
VLLQLAKSSLLDLSNSLLAELGKELHLVAGSLDKTFPS